MSDPPFTVVDGMFKVSLLLGNHAEGTQRVEEVWLHWDAFQFARAINGTTSAADDKRVADTIAAYLSKQPVDF